MISEEIREKLLEQGTAFHWQDLEDLERHKAEAREKLSGTRCGNCDNLICAGRYDGVVFAGCSFFPDEPIEPVLDLVNCRGTFAPVEDEAAAIAA